MAVRRSDDFYERGSLTVEVSRRPPEEQFTAGSVEDETERHLTTGLIGPHFQAYLNSASFHQQIDLLVRMLPIWVDGLAAAAAVSDKYQAEALAALAALRYLPTVDVGELRDLLKPS